ncbi:MAG: hypothetical protein L3K19_00180 [Thermoplasmata archaeon]|nr:hypothetical protein [Thermoplasmata archaeon]
MDQFAELIRRYSDANRLRTAEDQFQDPWEFVRSELERLDEVAEQREDLRLELGEAGRRLAQALQQIAGLDRSVRQWAAAYGAMEAESKQLMERSRQQYASHLDWLESGWQKHSRRMASQLAEKEAALRDVHAQLSSEKSERARIERLFLLLFDERDRLMKECRSRHKELLDAYDLMDDLLNQIESPVSGASPSSEGSN